ncbi:hypothetical protein BpHYR1_023672 [Brachionus plicatilis]|uniref:Uncharacterized protein n=1 Tax=Brachionus plicatilis TaxID=10195 RepID=A0A3M7QY20_BRAPC|nr:hypothetical protein BpHYR1_023672 [Brachionus plicatilis]
MEKKLPHNENKSIKMISINFIFRNKKVKNALISKKGLAQNVNRSSPKNVTMSILLKIKILMVTFFGELLFTFWARPNKNKKKLFFGMSQLNIVDILNI